MTATMGDTVAVGSNLVVLAGVQGEPPGLRIDAQRAAIVLKGPDPPVEGLSAQAGSIIIVFGAVLDNRGYTVPGGLSAPGIFRRGA
jgi:hypothetical protein